MIDMDGDLESFMNVVEMNSGKDQTKRDVFPDDDGQMASKSDNVDFL
jgi:hypothetical protein